MKGKKYHRKQKWGQHEQLQIIKILPILSSLSDFKTLVTDVPVNNFSKYCPDLPYSKG